MQYMSSGVWHSDWHQQEHVLLTWEGLDNGLRDSRIVADVGNDATPWSQPLAKLSPHLHLKSRQDFQ